MSRENLNTLLERIGQIISVDLSLGPEDLTLIRVDARIDLAISYDEPTESVVLSASCGTLPGEDDPAAALKLAYEVLDANNYWTGTGGGTLSTNSVERTLYLQFREQTTALDEERLHFLFSTIVDNATRWADRLERGSWELNPAEADAKSDSSDPDSDSDSLKVSPGRGSDDDKPFFGSMIRI